MSYEINYYLISPPQAQLNHYEPQLTRLSVSLICGFQVVANCYTFSSISGSHLNPCISFALYLVGKLSNNSYILYVCHVCFVCVFKLMDYIIAGRRKLITYTVVQVFASLCALWTTTLMFDVHPNDVLLYILRF